MKKQQHKWHDGYHFGVLCCTITAGTVLFINLILTIVASTKLNIADGIGTLQDGDCDETKRIDLWLHLLINILSTLLLGASNYSMQCLSAPTRQDIENAHRQYRWMDVGVPSMRNVLRISWPRKMLWCLLLISSVPLHLTYNSVIFSSTSFSEWQGFAVTNDFLTGSPFRVKNRCLPVKAITETLGRLQNSTSLTRLENTDCVAIYNSQLVSEWSDVLVISTQQSRGNSFLNLTASFTPVLEHNPTNYNLCLLTPDHCDHTDGTLNPESWTLPSVGSPLVSHCMAEKASQHCKMRFSMYLMTAVLACNLVKVTCMALMIWKMDPYPLVTIGDAIASFLDSPGTYSFSPNYDEVVGSK